MRIKLDAIRECLEGVIPGNIATRAADGTPNIAYLSQAKYVDSEHVALSYQFFNTTRRNILAFPYARVSLINPLTGAHCRLSLRYLRTEEAGPLFENMKVRLAGIASHTGMSGVFRLLGADVYRVLDIEQVPGYTLPAPPPPCNLLAALRASAERLCGCGDLDSMLAEFLVCLEQFFDIRHAMVLLLDEAGERLYTVASRGYAESGVGSEIAVGDGVIGVAARERTPIRIGHFTAEYSYGRAIRESLTRRGLAGAVETEIPLPGLPESRSQLAVPIKACQRLTGVLYVESPQDLRFSYDDEDALVALAGQLGVAIRLLQQGQEGAECAEGGDQPPVGEAAVPAVPVAGAPLRVRHYAENDSVFLDGDYLIKGVAGSIFWALVRDYDGKGQQHFSNRELRLDPRIRLPDISDNLEARLILLARRLVERAAPLRIEKTGRGRFRLHVERPLSLVEIAGDGS
ncbi:GAF domain-containing protein [Azospira restricta]|uniref:GAF domain-containing protein n=1 Tax=Azospira restricta TaxID=404405 RepID=A0A974PVH5_9RHOO|nr:GAF domain-containing protein [Azospira restricta]QRJ62278.1 GAF domain-containing protein [Azospira restricta]